MGATMRLGVIAGALVLIMAACGDSGTETTTDGAGSISVTSREFEFNPDLWLVPAGADVSVTVSNEGTIEHNFVVLSEAISDEEQFTEALVVFSVSTPAGETSRSTFTAPAAGTYQVICNIDGHFGAGMVGQLSVGE